MLAVDTLNPRASPSQFTALPQHHPARQEHASRHPPRKASLASKSPAELPKPYAPINPKPSTARVPQAYKDIRIDRWTRKIFSIISDGPAGGFVSYAISPMNELFVDRTGNRAELDDVVSDLLPDASCRYIAYNLRYRQDDQDKLKIIWIMWTPKSVKQPDAAPFLNGLATTLISLKCPSSIPIIEAKSTEELSLQKVLVELTNRRPSESSSSSISSQTTT